MNSVLRNVLPAVCVVMLSLVYSHFVGATARAQAPTTPKTIPEDGLPAPGNDEDALEQVRGELAELRREFNRRISEVEVWFKDEVDRLDAKLDRQTDVAKLRAELENLQAEQEQLAGTVSSYGRTINDPQTGVVKTSEAVKQHEVRLDGHEQQLNTQERSLMTLSNSLNQNTTSISEHSGSLRKHDQQIADATTRIDGVEERVDESDARFRDIAKQGFVDPSYRIKLLGNMQTHPELRNELLRNTRHRLRIHNTTGSEQSLFVNGVRWTVRADEWTYAPIPLGPVTIHRLGCETLEVPEDQIHWEPDDRGYFVEYDFDNHRVKSPAADE